LVPPTGWYEWQKLDAKNKRPIHMSAKATPFTLAGVYDVWTVNPCLKPLLRQASSLQSRVEPGAPLQRRRIIRSRRPGRFTLETAACRSTLTR
jgi:hypothetical protein